MNDREFITAFEEGTLPHFPHHAHVRMAWIYLRAAEWAEGKSRICQGIRQLSVKHGAPRKYHETMTVFWARMVKQAIISAPQIVDFEAFASANPHLFDSKLIGQYYSPTLLASEEARQTWVEPDLKPLPA